MAGIKGVPLRLRLRISWKCNDEEGTKEKLYSYLQAVNITNQDVNGLHTQVVEGVKGAGSGSDWHASFGLDGVDLHYDYAG